MQNYVTKLECANNYGILVAIEYAVEGVCFCILLIYSCL